VARTIRVAGVPGDFRVPRGWPVPTDRWIRTNAFWVPPEGWTPTPGLRPAPKGWGFWRVNSLWLKTSGHLYKRARAWSSCSFAAVVIALAARVVSSLADLEVLAIVAIAALLVALALQVTYLISYIRITRRALRDCAEMAEESRHRRLTREYQRYLLDTA